MRTPLGGNKQSHLMTQRINARMRAARLRRNLSGEFESATDSVRRQMAQRETIQELIVMPISHAPVVTVEGCAVE